MNPVVVLPVARFDHHLAVRWLRWATALQTGENFALVVICSPAVTGNERAVLEKATEEFGGPVRFEVTNNITELGYFGGTPNRVFLASLEFVEREYPGHPMLWCEADTVPMHAGWYEAIRAEYETCGKPFMGDHYLQGPVHHMTGVAVYPPNWRKLSPLLAALPGPDPRIGWDSSCSKDTLPQSARSMTIRQVWRPAPFTKANWRSIVPEGTALFHQCKDGTLIDVLAEEAGLPPIPREPQICVSTYESDVAEMTKCLHNGVYSPDGTIAVNPGRKMSVEILIVTYAKDMGFLQFCLQSIDKYAKGFLGVALVVPRHERHLFVDLPMKVRLIEFDEPAGKGMLAHEVEICRADLHCPTADAILHVDPDFCFWKKFTPDDVAPNGAPRLLRELYSDCGVRNPNRMLWKTATIETCGIVPEWETMVAHPFCHIREVYPLARTLTEKHTNKSFSEHFLSGRNHFPQQVCEFNLLGAVALKYFSGAYTLVNYDHEADRIKAGLPKEQAFQYVYFRDRDVGAEVWSHAGIKRYEADLRQWVSGGVPAFWVK